MIVHSGVIPVNSLEY